MYFKPILEPLRPETTIFLVQGGHRVGDVDVGVGGCSSMGLGLELALGF